MAGRNNSNQRGGQESFSMAAVNCQKISDDNQSAVAHYLQIHSTNFGSFIQLRSRRMWGTKMATSVSVA